MQEMTGAKVRKQMQWRQRLARFAACGLPVKEFCQSEAISTASFYRWQKELELSGDAGPMAAGFIDAGALRVERKAVPLNEDAGAGLEIRLELGHGLVLHIARR